MPYDVEAEVDAAIMEIAQAFGTRTDKVAPIVDEYGCELALAALGTVQGEMRNGYRPSSPLGYMISLLRKGVIQVAVIGAADPNVDWLRDRYYNAQADPGIDTAAKRLGGGITLQESADKRGFVMLNCGHFVVPVAGVRCRCGQEFSG